MNELPNIESLKESVDKQCKLKLSLLSVEVVREILKNAVGDYLLAYYELEGEKELFNNNYDGFMQANEEDRTRVINHAQKMAGKNEKQRNKFPFPIELRGLLEMYYNVFTKEIEIRRLHDKIEFLGNKIVETKELINEIEYL